MTEHRVVTASGQPGHGLPAHGLAGRFVEWLMDRLQPSEMERMGPAEVSRMAQDLGLSSDELQRLAAGEPDAARLLYQRLELIGLTRADIEKAGAARDMERTCALCDARGACEHDMAERPQSEAWKAYCPNEGTLAALQEEKARTAGPTEKACCCGKC